MTCQAHILGIKTPEIGIFAGTNPNAFAADATKNSSLVAINTWLINAMNKDELEAIIGLCDKWRYRNDHVITRRH